MSAANTGPERAATAARPIFDVEEWQKNSKADFFKRLDELVDAASTAGNDDARTAARIDLARFYMARGFYHEAKAVLDLALSEQTPGKEDPVLLIVHSVASSLTNYTRAAFRDLANPAIGANYDSQLWKALALAREHKWAEAREKFKNVQFAITALPIDLQRPIVADAMRASISRDIARVVAEVERHEHVTRALQYLESAAIGRARDGSEVRDRRSALGPDGEGEGVLRLALATGLGGSGGGDGLGHG